MNIEPYNPLGDYCTNWFDRLQFWWINWDWSRCCYEHDVAYATLIPKGMADGALRECVFSVVGFPGIGITILMYLGVSLFGWAYYAQAILKAGDSK